MSENVEQCRRCGREIPQGAAVYGDHNRKFCSQTCAGAQLDLEQGVGHARAARSDLDMAGDRVPPGGGPAVSRKRSPRER